MLDIEERLRVFWASNPRKAYRVFVLRIYHSSMTQPYYLWREPFVGTVTLPVIGSVSVTPANIRATVSGSETDLDQGISISISTVKTMAVLRTELDRISLGAEDIQMNYYEYLSDDLITCLSQVKLQVESLSMQRGLATFSAVSPRLNKTRTGVVYTPKDYPTLRGFL